MKADGGALVALASSIADGEPVDWAEAEASAGDERERAIIKRLKLIASIGDVHRSADDLDEPRGRVVGRIRPTESAAVAGDPAGPALVHTIEPDGPAGGSIPSPPLGAPPSGAASRSVGASGGGPAGSAPEPEPGTHWGRLELRERVGAGVFGEVYRAYDPQLQREVAVKLLRTGTKSADALASKVLHEGRLLARVRHRHVVTVHGVETHGDRVGLWMELVRGCSLEDLLDRQGSFSGREAALIGQDVCRALAAVHGAGLLHRDVKAQNVMREEGGRVVLMDFGTGLVLDHADAVRTASIAGTPLYLAPEVLNGRDASPASDVYSVGVLLFHLVTSTYPYAVRSLNELRDAQRRGDRKRLQDLRPDLPEGFVQVVDRAIEVDPALRYPSAGALQQALSTSLGLEASLTGSAGSLAAPAGETEAATRQTKPRAFARFAAIGAGLVAVLALAVWGISQVRTTPLPPVDSVVVLPFTNLGSENDDLARGIQLLINDRLASLSQLRFVHYTPEMQARDRGLAVGDVIARHDVSAALEGDVTWSAAQATVAVRLIRAGSSTPAWVRQFERPSRRAIELPRDVAREIVRAMSVRLTAADEARLADADSASPAVFESYLRGRAQMRLQTQASTRLAITHFLEALKQDPNHAPSLAAIAECYLLEGVTFRGRPLAEAASMARQAASHALSIDDDLAAAHEAEAQVKFFADWDADGADQSYRRAIELSPSSGETRQHYAMFLVSRRRLPDAMQQMQTAVSLDPTSSNAQSALGMIWHYARSHDQAERAFRGVLATNPASRQARNGLVRTLNAVGRYAEALSHLEELSRESDGRLTPGQQAALGLANAGLGRMAEARAIAERLVTEDSADGPSTDAASVFGAIGDHDRAIAILEQAVAEKAPKALFLRMDPRFDPLRTDARFVRLMTRLGFSS